MITAVRKGKQTWKQIIQTIFWSSAAYQRHLSLHKLVGDALKQLEQC